MRIIRFNLGGKAYIYKKLHTLGNWIYGGCSVTVLRLQLTTEMAGLAAHPELGSLAGTDRAILSVALSSS